MIVLTTRRVVLSRGPISCIYKSRNFATARPFDKDPRILIVGNDVGGVALALALRQRGLNSDILHSPQKESGLYIGVNGMRVIKSLSESLYESVKKAGQSITVHEIKSEKGAPYGRVSLEESGAKHGVLPIGIARSTLFSLMLKECNQSPRNQVGRITLATTGSFLGTGSVEAGKPIMCRFSGGRTNSVYDVIVGAEGSLSKVRDDFFQGKEYDVKKRFCGFFTLSGIAERPFLFDSTGLSELWGNGRKLVGIPINNNQVQMFGSYYTDHPPTLYNEGSRPAKEFETNFKSFGGFAPHLFYSLEHDKKSSCQFIIPREIRMKKYVNGRIVLLGDAAHTPSPNLHIAETLSLEDAVVLADCLASTTYPTLEERLEAYNTLRVARVERVMDAAWEINTTGFRQTRIGAWRRTWEQRAGVVVKREKNLVDGFEIPAIK